MRREIDERELRNDSETVLREVEHGETLVVTRNGVPVAELSPPHRHQFVPVQRVLDVFRDAPAIDGERFFADLDGVGDPNPPSRH